MDISTTFVNPSELTPLFTAQQVVCAYPISDVWASTPRYLYYCLLVLTLVVRTRSWLAQVFLGAAAAYAGAAAIEAFILLAKPTPIADIQLVSIPFIDSASVRGNDTLEALYNLVTDTPLVEVAPAVMELDIDAILAVVITGFLSMLPMHCWSHTVRAYRALHLLVGIWNILMLAGSICALVLWPTLDWNTFPFQYRFCYPDYPDDDSTSNDGTDFSSSRLSWNDTTWQAFRNLSASLSRSSNCLYPCFNTTQILRQQSAATANLNTNGNPRTSNNLSDAQYVRFDELTHFMYAALGVSALTALFLLGLNISGLRRFTRVPVHRPQSLWAARKELWHALATDARCAFWTTQPPTPCGGRSQSHSSRSRQHPAQGRLHEKARACLRFLVDAMALTALAVATVFVPLTNVVFIVWIEWFIHRDVIGKETPKQVGQWSSLAAVGLVLCSALVLRARYRIASTEEIESDVRECRARLEALESLRDQRLQRERAQTAGGVGTEMARLKKADGTAGGAVREAGGNGHACEPPK